jgi:hypothetical protein
MAENRHIWQNLLKMAMAQKRADDDTCALLKVRNNILQLYKNIRQNNCIHIDL